LPRPSGLTVAERDRRAADVLPLRDRIIGRVLEEIPEARLTGHPEVRLPITPVLPSKIMDGNLLLTPA